jgi:hypothetical protein
LPEPDVEPRSEDPLSRAGLLAVERHVSDLRDELGLFVDRATDAMQRIDHLLDALREAGSDDPPEGHETTPGLLAPARGRGFVGGWRPKRS